MSYKIKQVRYHLGTLEKRFRRELTDMVQVQNHPICCLNRTMLSIVEDLCKDAMMWTNTNKRAYCELECYEQDGIVYVHHLGKPNSVLFKVIKE